MKSLAIDAGWFLGGRAAANLTLLQLERFGVLGRVRSMLGGTLRLSGPQAQGVVKLAFGAALASFGPRRGTLGKVTKWAAIASATDGVSGLVKPFLGSYGNLLGEMDEGYGVLGDWDVAEDDLGMDYYDDEAMLGLGDWETVSTPAEIDHMDPGAGY